jgi:uncharacterized membrane-anchored protein
MLTPLKHYHHMKAHSTRTPPNYALILIIVSSMIFWLGIIKVFFGHEIKEWIKSILSLIS